MSPLQGALLGIDDVFTPGVAAAAVELSGGCDPEVAANAERIYAELRAEELRFRKTLAQGRRVLADMLQVIGLAASYGRICSKAGSCVFTMSYHAGFATSAEQSATCVEQLAVMQTHVQTVCWL